MSGDTLDSIANTLAGQLRSHLDEYQELLNSLDVLIDKKDGLETKIVRAKKAIEVLTGTSLPVPGFEEVGEQTPVPEVGPIPGSHAVQAVPAPVTVPPRPSEPLCSGCGSGKLVETYVTTSKGRRIRVLQCQDSSCNSQYPC